MSSTAWSMLDLNFLRIISGGQLGYFGTMGGGFCSTSKYQGALATTRSQALLPKRFLDPVALQLAGHVHAMQCDACKSSQF